MNGEFKKAMDKYCYNVAKVYLLTCALYPRRGECPGCKDGQLNQLAHMSDCGIGCLDSLVDIPCEWYEDAYALLSVEKVDNLYSLLMHKEREICACDGISLFVDSALKEAVLNEDFGKEWTDLCCSLQNGIGGMQP